MEHQRIFSAMLDFGAELIPVSSLYYMLYGFVTGSNTIGRESATKLFITCLAIVPGFMVVEAVNRFIRKAP